VLNVTDLEIRNNWIKSARDRTELGHPTVVLAVPNGGYQTMPKEMAEKKYADMIIYPVAVEKIEVLEVTLQEYGGQIVNRRWLNEKAYSE
jgi:hypothetical protein